MKKSVLYLVSTLPFALSSCLYESNTIYLGFGGEVEPTVGIRSALITEKQQGMDCKFEFYIGEIEGRNQPLLQPVEAPLAYYLHICVYDISKTYVSLNVLDPIPGFPNAESWFYSQPTMEGQPSPDNPIPNIVFNQHLDISCDFSKVVESNLTEGWVGFRCNILNTNFLDTIDSFSYYGDINVGGIGGVFWLKFEILHNKYVLFSE